MPQVKILEHGKGDWHRVKCPHCKSKLQIDESDVYLRDERDEDGALESVARVTCAACHEGFRVNVPGKVIDSRIESERRSDHDL